MHHDFTEDWYGWRLRGGYLVAPDGQRMTRTRLEGLMFRDKLELRRAGYASRRTAEAGRVASGHQRLVKVVVVTLDEYRRGLGYSIA